VQESNVGVKGLGNYIYKSKRGCWARAGSRRLGPDVSSSTMSPVCVTVGVAVLVGVGAVAVGVMAMSGVAMGWGLCGNMYANRVS
jgi:hypothetical protein